MAPRPNWLRRFLLTLLLPFGVISQAAPGDLDSSFSSGTGGFGISAIEHLPGDKLIVAGDFAGYNGVSRPCLARLNANGALDETFNPPGGPTSGKINDVEVQSDGKLLVAGSFLAFNGQDRRLLVRLQDSGAIDEGFVPQIDSQLGNNTTGYIAFVKLQPDGKILLAGLMKVAGESVNRMMVRLNSDGSVDQSFQANFTGTFQGPYNFGGMALLPDGKILVSGSFAPAGQTESFNLIRLRSDGSVDPSFQPVPSDSVVACLAVQPDGKILLTGSSPSLKRLLPSGAVDPSFTVSFESTDLLALQPDGKILKASSSGLRRLNADGSVDAGFASPVIPFPLFKAIHLDPAGRIVLAGAFTQVNGLSQNGLVRLQGGDASSSSATQFRLAHASYSVREAEGIARVGVIRGGGNTTAASVNYTVTGETAGESDFNAASGTLSFAAGETFKWIPIVVTNDTEDEADEIVRVALSEPVAGTILEGADNAILTIIDDENRGAFEWRPAVLAVREDSNEVTLRVVRNGQTTGNVSVNYTTTTGSAAANEDYAPVSGTLSFADGEDFKTVTIPLHDDSRKEGPETIGLQLSIPTGGAVLGSDQSATITLIDHDMPGSLVTDFSTTPLPENFEEKVRAVVELADGKILVADGVGPYALRRLNANGSIDTSFAPQFPEFASVVKIFIQPSGKIILFGGNLRSEDGVRKDLVRLKADGTLDGTFDAGSPVGSIACVEMQPDGKLLVAGDFVSMGGGSRTNFARLMPDGALDPSFTVLNPPTPPGGSVKAMLVQPDGKILVAGTFSFFAGRNLPGIVRLHPGGEADLSFSVTGLNYNFARLSAIALQPDGKILAGGYIPFFNGFPRTLVRFLPDGTLDSTFDAWGIPSQAGSIETTLILVQPDGKIIANGSPTFYPGSTSYYGGTVRLNPDGTRDDSFQTLDYIPGSVAALLRNGDVLLSQIINALRTPLVKVIGGEYDRPTGGRLEFGWPSYPVNEMAGTAVVHIVRRDGNTGPVSVDYATADGTAQAGRDYSSRSGTLTFAAGEVAKAIEVPIVNTPEIDGTREFSVSLTNPQGATLGATAIANIPINDDERPGQLQFESDTVAFREGASATVKVRRFFGSDGRITVNYAASGQTATAGTDYQLAAGTLVFEAGELEQSIVFNLPTDGAIEGTETFTIQLSGITGGASLGTTAAMTVTIHDIDDGGSLTEIAALQEFTTIDAMGRQSDGKVVVVGGLAGSSGRKVIRLNRDGTRDAEFAGTALSGSIKSIAFQADGKIVLGGLSLSISGAPGPRGVLRLEANGTPDASFSPPAVSERVNAVAVQSDGKIVVAGAFITINNVQRRYLARLLNSGALDETFQPAVSNQVPAMLVNADDTILFLAPTNKIVRLNPNGTVDPGFSTDIYQQFAPSTSNLACMALDRRGRILVGGYFTAVNGQPRKNLARLLPNGQLDPTFDAGNKVDAAPDAIAIQDDGRIFAGSYYYYEDGGIFRFFDDGAADPSFKPLPISGVVFDHVTGLAFLEDAGLLVSGKFKLIDGVDQSNYALLLPGRLPGAFQFASADAIDIEEGVSQIDITVLRVGGSEGRATVAYQTQAASASEGADYGAINGTLVFEDGETSKSFSISIVEDSRYERPEQFLVRLSGPETAFLWEADKLLQVNIADDDPPLYGTLQFAASSLVVNEDDGVAIVTIERVGGSDEDISVSYATVPGTAKSGTDFAERIGIINFPDGVTSRTLEIPILGGDLAEPEESFSVVLSPPIIKGTLGTPSSITVTIADNDTGTLDVYRGSYAGLLQSGSAPMDGRITISVGTGGKISGVIMLGKQRYTFRGTLNADGKVSITVPRRGDDPLELTFQLEVLAPETEQVTGFLSVSGVVFQFAADRQTFHSTKNPSLAAGRYAVAFEPGSNSNLPPGGGYASMTITKGGVARIAGKLADGTAFAGSSFVTKTNGVPLYVPLYGKSGVLSGTLQLIREARWNCSGEANWVKPPRENNRYYPGGFTGPLSISGTDALGKEFGIPVASQVDATLSGGNLNAPMGPFTLERPLANLLRGPEGLRLKLNPANGLITGEFKHPQTRHLTTIRGVFLSNENRGAGFFLGSESGGAFELEVVPPEGP